MTDERKRQREKTRYQALTPEEKELRRQKQKQYRDANRDAINAKQKLRYEANKEEYKEKERIRYSQNKDKYKQRHEEYRRANYDLIREKQRAHESTPEEVERRKEYNAQYRKEHAEELKMYAKINKDRIAELRQLRDAQHKEQRCAESELMSTTEAGVRLGVASKTIRSWILSGKLERASTLGGKIMVKRADVEALCLTQAADDNIAKVLKLVRKVGDFEVPDNFDLITTYEQLAEYTSAFAERKINFLLLVGSPGSGKSRQMRSEVGGRCMWIDNHVTNLGLYCSVYESHGKPVVLDDVNHFLANKQACSLLKALCQTDETKSISWESPVKYLEDREVPRQYTTTSPMCLIANMWDAKNADMAAIQDRALPVAFYPSAETVHERVLQLGWCPDKEITAYIGDNLPKIPQPSMREYFAAMQYKRANMDWRKKMAAVWGLDTAADMGSLAL